MSQLGSCLGIVFPQMYPWVLARFSGLLTTYRGQQSGHRLLITNRESGTFPCILICRVCDSEHDRSVSWPTTQGLSISTKPISIRNYKQYTHPSLQIHVQTDWLLDFYTPAIPSYCYGIPVYSYSRRTLKPSIQHRNTRNIIRNQFVQAEWR